MADPAAATEHDGEGTSETGLRGENDDSDEFLLDEDSDGDSICTSGDDASSGEDSQDYFVEDSDEDWVPSLPSEPLPTPSNVGTNKRKAAGRGQGGRGGRGRARICRDETSSPGMTEESWNDTGVQDASPPAPVFKPQRTPGPQLVSSASYTPLQLFQLFLTNTMLQTIINNTNERARRASTLAAPWTDVSLNEMYRFVALLIYMGLVKCCSFGDYWRKSKLYELPFPRSVMTSKRFRQISCLVHLSSREEDAANDGKRGTPSYDRLCKIKPLYAELREACRSNYHPAQNISIAERVVPSKSRIGLKQYMKRKRTRWGFKLFVLADSSTGYTWDFFVYEGKAHESSRKGQGYDAVMQLVDTTSLGTGYKLFVDYYYTSPTLFRDLLQRKIWPCGTIRVPPQVKANALDSTSARGSIRWMRKDNLLFLQWKDSRDVFLCSALHTAHGEDTVQRRVKSADGQFTVKDIPVPPAVKEYNQHIGGVDLSDALISYYKVAHKTRRWYMAFFYHFIDIAIVNAFILHKEHVRSRGGTPLLQKTFRETLAMELAGMATAEPAPRSSDHHRLVHISGDSTTGRLRCRHCKAKTPVKCSTCDMPLCFVAARDCYNEWHVLQNK